MRFIRAFFPAENRSFGWDIFYDFLRGVFFVVQIVVRHEVVISL